MVAQLVETLRYKTEGRMYEFFIDTILADPNEYQEYFLGGRGGLCLGLTTLPPSYADCLEIWELETHGNLLASQGLYRDSFTFDMVERSPSNGYWLKKI